jgi:hypothetical protein
LKDGKIFTCRSFLLIFAILSVPLVIYSAFQTLKIVQIFEKDDDQVVFKPRQLWIIGGEILLISLHPPLYAEYQFSIPHRISSKLKNDPIEATQGIYALDQIFALLSVFKAAYFITKVALPGYCTTLTPELARQINEVMRGIRIDFLFYFNVAMMQRPVLIISGVLGFLIICFGLLV